MSVTVQLLGLRAHEIKDHFKRRSLADLNRYVHGGDAGLVCRGPVLQAWRSWQFLTYADVHGYPAWLRRRSAGQARPGSNNSAPPLNFFFFFFLIIWYVFPQENYLCVKKKKKKKYHLPDCLKAISVPSDSWFLFAVLCVGEIPFGELSLVFETISGCEIVHVKKHRFILFQIYDTTCNCLIQEDT